MNTLKILSMNMWVCAGDFEKRWPCLLAAMKSAQDIDVFVFQENARLESYSRSTVEVFADELGMEARFSWHWDRNSQLWGSMGNAFLTRLPILDFEPRSLQSHEEAILHSQMRLEVSLPNGLPLNIYNCHLPYRSFDAINRESQAVKMVQWMGEREHKVSPLWCGDFNSVSSSSTYRFMTGEQSLQGVSTGWTDLMRDTNDGNSPPTIGECLPRDACVDYVFQRSYTGIDDEIRPKCTRCALAFNEPMPPNNMLVSDHAAIEAWFEVPGVEKGE